MRGELLQLRHELESKIEDGQFDSELSGALDATIILIEYLERHPNLGQKAKS